MRENEVRKLLEKLPLDTITLDPYIVGKIDSASKQIKEHEKKEQYAEEMRKKLIQKKSKKNKKRSNEVIQDMHRFELTKETIRHDNELKKKLYKAEKTKMDKDMHTLNDDIEDIIDVTKENLRKLMKDN